MPFTDNEMKLLKDNTDVSPFETSSAKPAFGLTDSNYIICDSEKHMLKGLIAFEGIDGSGKSSILEALSQDQEFQEMCDFSCEPQKKDFGKALRDYIETNTLSTRAFSHAIAADREMHIQDIKKSIENNKLHITDRYVMSSFAYQGSSCFDINLHFPRAEFTFFFNVPIETSLERSSSREVTQEAKGLVEMFESRPKLEKTKSNYDQLREIPYFNTITIDSTLPFENVLNIVKEKVRKIKALN